MSQAYKTALTRKAPSAPMRKLDELGLLHGCMLDYGSGKGYDAYHFGMSYYDPHFQPVMPTGLFDTITCNYVLNVVESEQERYDILYDIIDRLKPRGLAYVTVRTGKGLNGTTKRGTWQGAIELQCPIVARGSGYVTYEVYSDDFVFEII